ncbi:MAG: phosphoribosyltransferase family protein [Leptolyngbyaceae cyanobacterium bins.302]|nr:phosphoribosyltransferase family protein [Leptolyngbyaceae cyanobacterium bins.302]
MTFGSLTQPPDSTVCFTDRLEAGELLAQAALKKLEEHSQACHQSCVVYALPRGGLAIAAPISQQLQCPLDVIVAKKITRPENPELAIGAVTADGHTLWLPRTRSQREPAYLNEIALHKAQERASLQDQQFEPSRPQVSPTGKIALVVDDGVATGMTMAVAVQALRAQNPAQVWICVPVAPSELLSHLQTWADQVVILATPSPFQSVSRFYKEFNQVEMDTAIALLQATNQKLHEG